MSDELRALFPNINFVNDDDRGAGILLEWVKHSPNIVGLVQSIMPEIQELYDAQQDIFSTINIFEAVGTQLDDIFGEYLNTNRNAGQTDDSYRLDLLSAFALLTRSGEIAIMKSIYKSLLGASTVSLYEYQPAAFRLTATATTIPSDDDLPSIRATLKDAKQGGNNMTLAVTDKVPFKLGNPSSQQLNHPNGLSGNGFTGGTLSKGF